MARLDLQREVAAGTTLNDIRRRYGKGPVEGDDSPMTPIQPQPSKATERCETHVFDLYTILYF